MDLIIINLNEKPILGLIRCNKKSKFRFLFDYSHRIIGMLGFLFSSKFFK
jgi:hypothetical protein